MKNNTPRFSGLRNGEMMRVARNVTLREVRETLAFIAVAVWGLWWVLAL